MPTPSIGRRLVARVIDYVIISAVGGGLGQLTGYGVPWLVATALLVLLYFVVGDVLAGRTIGKAWFGLHVEGPNGARPSFGQALTREAFVLLGAIPFAGPLLALVAWIAMLVTIRKSPEGQGWHDRLAGTRVR